MSVPGRSVPSVHIPSIIGPPSGTYGPMTPTRNFNYNTITFPVTMAMLVKEYAAVSAVDNDGREKGVLEVLSNICLAVENINNAASAELKMTGIQKKALVQRILGPAATALYTDGYISAITSSQLETLSVGANISSTIDSIVHIWNRFIRPLAISSGCWCW